MKYVQHVRGKWIVRIAVPDELRDIIGQRELVYSDLPSDTRARERYAHGIINRLFAQLDEAREALAKRENGPNVTMSMAAKAHYADTLTSDTHKRTNMPTDAIMKTELDRLGSMIGTAEISSEHPFNMINAMTDYELMLGARNFYVNHRQRRLHALRASFSSGETRWIEFAVQNYVTDNKMTVLPGSPEWLELANSMMRAEIEALERTLERDKGNYAGNPHDPLLTMPDADAAGVPRVVADATGMKLTEALVAFHKERSAGGKTLAPKTMEEHRNAVRMFAEFMGGEVAVKTVTKKNVIDYKQTLLETPNRYTMRFPGLTLPEAVKANAKLTPPFKTLSPKTINMKWLSHLSSILQWASNNGHIEINPAQGIRVDTGSRVHQEASYLSFTRDELQIIFGHPMFSDPASYGLNQWALLLMLYTGVRNSSEMASMKLSNIFYEQDVPVFNLAEASKNERSKRLVPIHNDLIRLGFLKYVEKLRRSEQELLFPEWAKTTDKVNNWFNISFLVKVGIKSKQKVFYSFRHTLATELARAGVPRETSKMISGHAPQEVASIYIQASPVTLMADALNKVKFDLPIGDLLDRQQIPPR